jgi:hypothetical protein
LNRIIQALSLVISEKWASMSMQHGHRESKMVNKKMKKKINCWNQLDHGTIKSQNIEKLEHF